ncbi:MAG: hypothetical protein AB1722_07635 [Pseudomonadota bacterium]
MATEQKIYVALLEEGTDVWRPVMAKQTSNESFLILGEVPAEESWQFLPGTHVRCEEHVFSGGMRGLVAVEAVHA